jgi:hypothetical protein
VPHLITRSDSMLYHGNQLQYNLKGRCFEKQRSDSSLIGLLATISRVSSTGRFLSYSFSRLASFTIHPNQYFKCLRAECIYSVIVFVRNKTSCSNSSLASIRHSTTASPARPTSPSSPSLYQPTPPFPFLYATLARQTAHSGP